MLATNALTYAYPGGELLEFPNINCNRGEHWLLLGQSGSGKTTLLHLLAGLRTPQSGSIKIDDREMTALKGAALDKFRGQHIGIIFQTAHFIKSLTVLENLNLARTLAGLSPDKKRISELLDRLNIGHKLNVKTDQLSVGEQQRVAIARAIVNQPVLILADEPTSALDDKNTGEVIQLLEEQAKMVDATLVVVTHDNRLTSHFNQQITL